MIKMEKYGFLVLLEPDSNDWFSGTYKQCLDQAKKYQDTAWKIEDPEGIIVAEYDPNRLI